MINEFDTIAAIATAVSNAGIGIIRISGDEIPTEAVKSRFLKLNKEHIGYVMDSMRQNTTRITNIRAYMLSALYNAPLTISQYYTSLVSHDMAHGFQ